MRLEAEWYQFVIAGLGALAVAGVMAFIGSKVPGFLADLIFATLVLIFAVLAVSVKVEEQGGEA